MSWVSVAMIGAGAVMGGTGSMIGQKDSLDNQTGMANASNAALAKSNAKQQGFADQNAQTLGTDLSFYDPTAQAKQLAGAQKTRGDTNVANITGAQGAPEAAMQPGTPAAVGAEYNKRSGAAHDYATNLGTAEGNLGGYGDTWFQNALRDQQASRDIGVTNSFSNEEKSLLPAREQLAQTAAYKQPSIWGPLLQGGGNLLASAGGAKFGGSFGAPAAPTTNVWSAIPDTGTAMGPR